MEADVVVGPPLHRGFPAVKVAGVFPEDGAALVQLAFDEVAAFGLRQFSQFARPCPADGYGCLFSHLEGGRVWAVGVGKDVEVGDGKAADEVFALGKCLVVLAVEAGDDVGGDAGIGHHLPDMFYASGVERGVVVAVHGLQHFVRACLQGDMEMGEEGAGMGHEVYDFVGEQVGFDAGDAVAGHCLDVVQRFQQVDEAFAPLLSEGAGVHASQHYLSGAASGYLTGSGYGLGYGGAAAPPAGERNGAVAAEVVAAVLYLEERPGAVAFGVGELERAGLVGVNQWAAGGVEGAAGEYLQQAVLLLIAQDDVHAGYLCYPLSFILGETAYDGHGGFGVLRHGLTYGVAAFFFRNRGHGAAVYHIHIGFLVEADYVKSRLFEASLQMAGLSKV